TRGSHILGIARIVDIYSDRIKATPEQKRAYRLAADGDDQSHPQFSHGAEQGIQQWGGPENFHELIWPRMAELGGSMSVLEKYGVKVNERIMVPGVDI